MTPVREALELARKRIEYLGSFGHPRHQNANEKEFFPVIDAAIASLSAAPEEPCAVKPLEWRDHRPDSFPEPAWSAQTPFGFYNIEEVSASDSPAYVVRLHAHHFVADKDGLDEAKAAAQADYEQRIRSALVTTPQPAAGWDEAIEAAAKVVEDNTISYGSENCLRPRLHGDIHSLEYAEAIRSLHREAPAPAEAKETIMTEDQIKHMVDRFLGWKLPANFNPDDGISFEKFGNIGTEHQFERHPSGTNLLDAVQATAMVRYIIDGMPARPDTAEARLRKAFVQVLASLAAAISLLERTPKANKAAPSDTMFAIMLDDYRKALGAGRKALSPPSGGDEAKESDPPAWFEPITPSRLPIHGQEVDALNEERRREAWNNRPSEPSTPADRREIVARIIDPTIVRDIEGVIWSRFEISRRDDAFRKADAIRHLASGPEDGSEGEK